MSKLMAKKVRKRSLSWNGYWADGHPPPVGAAPFGVIGTAIALQDSDDDRLARLRKNDYGIALSKKGIANYVISINKKSREVAKFASCCVSLDH